MKLPDYPEFEIELGGLINKYNMENGSNTPNFVLAKYLVNCLLAFNTAQIARERWYGREPYVAAGEVQYKPASMTFEEFQATRTECADLGAAIHEETLMGAKGYLYLGSLWIEEVPARVWSGTVHETGCTMWHLLLGRKDWLNSSRTALEKLLYDWAIEEGRIPAVKDYSH